jgi:hypothetical protein
VTPESFIRTGQLLYGRRRWKSALARDLGVNVGTIHRMAKRAIIPGPYEVALKAMLENKRAQDRLMKEARKLLPRTFRKRSPRQAAARAKQIARKNNPAAQVSTTEQES